MDVLVVLLVLLMVTVNHGISQRNIPIGSFCGTEDPVIQSSMINNRNSTFAEIRRQLSNDNVFYARGQGLAEGNPIFGVAQCRNYLSTSQCVSCFDDAVSFLDSCLTANGANVIFDNCSLRYENFDDFYDDPNVVDGSYTPTQICGNQSTSQPSTIFRQVVDGLLADIKIATPRTSNFYVASTRQITSGNTTIYSFAQCVESTSQSICETCLDAIYPYLYNCIPNTEGKSLNRGCFARYSETSFFNDNQTIDITNFLKVRSSKVNITVGAIGGIVGLLILIILWVLLRIRNKSKKSEKGNNEKMDKNMINYNFKDLKFATNNFSQENILGEGSFGEVFKAILDDNNTVAVKKIKVACAEAKEEFKSEVKLVYNVHHRNLLRLLGWSNEGPHLLLVLEYMQNGSLNNFLWGAKRGTLNWKQRYDIILGIAKGLAHIHDELHVKIIHRDIKSGNILLDDNFQPKIADFGLARSQPADQSHINTKFAGTLGYTAPEYVLTGRLSDKVDTFSFGIVILEVISGRKCTDMDFDGPNTDYLLEHAWKLYESKEHMKLIDETMDVNQYEEEHVMKIIEIALMCTQSPDSRRPTMSTVVLILQDGQSSGIRQITRPPFLDHNNRRIDIGI